MPSKDRMSVSFETERDKHDKILQQAKEKGLKPSQYCRMIVYASLE